MKFEKGQSGNPKGRPFGAKNKTTKAMREWLLDLIVKNKKQINDDINALPAEKRLIILEKFMSYLLPKKFSADLEAHTELDIPTIQIEIIDNKNEVDKEYLNNVEGV